jgi:hypothetical protein
MHNDAEQALRRAYREHDLFFRFFPGDKADWVGEWAAPYLTPVGSLIRASLPVKNITKWMSLFQEAHDFGYNPPFSPVVLFNRTYSTDQFRVIGAAPDPKCWVIKRDRCSQAGKQLAMHRDYLDVQLCSSDLDEPDLRKLVCTPGFY